MIVSRLQREQVDGSVDMTDEPRFGSVNPTEATERACVVCGELAVCWTTCKACAESSTEVWYACNACGFEVKAVEISCSEACPECGAFPHYRPEQTGILR